MSDILYVQIVDRKIVIHTLDGEITGSITTQLERILSNYGFAQADSNKFVNLDKILIRDKKQKKLYFSADRTVYCPVTRSHYKDFFW